MAMSRAREANFTTHPERDGEPTGDASAVIDTRAVAESRLHCVARLSAYVAHGLSNPLAYVLGNLALLERDLAGLLDAAEARRAHRVREHIAVLREGANRIGDVVTNLKALAHPDASDRRPVDITAALDTALSLVDTLLHERALVERRYAGGVYVAGNEACLVHVLLAVLTHIADELPPASGGVVRLSVTREATGEAVIEAAWDRAAPQSDGPDDRGRDLGPSLARHLVHAQGGTMELVPVGERGGAFRLRLALAQPPAPSSAPPPVSEPNHKPRVLVVDDEPNLARLLSWTLDGFEVEGVTEASLALAKLLGGETYDAVLCDLHMPGLDGIDVYERVLAARPDLAARFLFVSGGAHTDRARRFLEVTKPRLLEKPFSPHRVAEALRKVVRT